MTTEQRDESADAGARFDEHFNALPSLQELRDELHRRDARFGARVDRAKRQRFKELLKEVKQGRISRFTAERIRANLSQQGLADKSGIPQANICRMERVGYEMRVSSARRIAAALGLSDYRDLLP
jgi:ribosome-binding protein aMBF1 (putative translation factor)